MPCSDCAALVSDAGRPSACRRRNDRCGGLAFQHYRQGASGFLDIALREKEERYRTIAEYAGDWEWWISPAGEFLYVSPACEEITGYPADRFVGEPGILDSILHPADKDRYPGGLAGIVSETPQHYDEFRIRHRDGREVWIGHLCRPVYGSDGQWLGRRATNRDITRQKELEIDLRRYERIIASTPNLVSVVDRGFVYRLVNDSYLATFGMRREDIVDRHVADVLGRDPFERVIRPRLEQCFSGETVTYEAWFDLPGAGRRSLSVTYYPYQDQSEEISAAVVSARDVTDKALAHEALRRNEDRLREAQRIAHVGDFKRDLYTGQGFWSDELYHLLGYEAQSMEPRFDDFIRRVHPDDRVTLLSDMREVLDRGGEKAIVFRVVHDDGRVLHLSGNVLVDLDDQGEAIRYHGALVDVTSLKDAEQELVRLATTDSLTGTSNRRHFLDLAKAETSRSLRHGRPLSLLMLDIDHFKAVNDTHGHEAGDVALRHVVDLVRAELRTSDLTGRLGGEEFAMLLPETGLAAALLVAERVRARIEATPVEACGHILGLTVSIGCAEVGTDGGDVKALLKVADDRMFEAKRSGRNRVIPETGRS